MSAPRPAPLRLAALDDLPDGELQAVIARAQSLLLDRPIAPESAPALAVEIVGREERRLLIFYRALAPLARTRVLRYMRLCYARARSALPVSTVPGGVRSPSYARARSALPQHRRAPVR